MTFVQWEGVVYRYYKDIFLSLKFSSSYEGRVGP